MHSAPAVFAAVAVLALVVASVQVPPAVQNLEHAGSAWHPGSRGGDVWVVNPKSYPLVGDTWTVHLEVGGGGILRVDAADGTEFGHDVEFSGMYRNNGSTINPASLDHLIFEDLVAGSYRFEVGVITDGPHHLQFSLGGNTAYASNTASLVNVTSNTADGNYGSGDTVDIRMNFTEPFVLNQFAIRDNDHDATRMALVELAEPLGITTATIDSSTYALVASSNSNSVQIINVTDPENPTIASIVKDGRDGFTELGGSKGITTTIIDGTTYALVTADNDNGVQIIDITTPSAPTPVAAVTDGVGGFTRLKGAWGITTAIIDGLPYALVTGSRDKGVQIINITTPSAPTPVAAMVDGVGGFTTLNNPRGITTIMVNNTMYALVAASSDSGVQIIDISTPSAPDPVAALSDGSDFTELRAAYDITTATINGTPYALVASRYDDGVQIINITDPENPTATATATDGSNFPNLNGPWGITTITIGSSTYALVIAESDKAVQIIDITDPENPEATSAVINGQVGLTGFDEPRGITTAIINGTPYALTTSADRDNESNNDGNSVQIINIADPENPVPTASVIKGQGGFTELDGASAITTVTIDSSTYALVGSNLDNGVQIIDVTDPTSPIATATVSDETERSVPEDGADNLTGDITTVTIGSSTYALVVATYDDAVHIINITDPASPIVTATVTNGTEFTALGWPQSITTVTIDTSTYALLASARDDGAVHIINITDPENPTATAIVTGGNQFPELGQPVGITTTIINNTTYALVTVAFGDGVKILNITDPENPTATAAVTDDQDGFTTLDSPGGITTITIDSSTYALVTSARDDGVQIINITDPENPTPTAAVTNGTEFTALGWPTSITTTIIDDIPYALVTSTIYGAVQIINIADPENPMPTTAVKDGQNGFTSLKGAFDITIVTIGSSTYAMVAARDDDAVQIIDITDPASPFDPLAPYISLDAAPGDPGRAVLTGETDGSHTLLFEYLVRANDSTADLAYTGTGAFSMGHGILEDADDGTDLAQMSLPVPGDPHSLSYNKDIMLSRNSTLTVYAGTDQTVGEGDTVTLSGSATDPDAGDTVESYLWSAPSGSGITFVDGSSDTATFIAPDVTSDTTFIITLAASDGLDSGTDQMAVTVKETSGAFILTWETTSADETVTVATEGEYTVIWGDGQSSEIDSTSLSHTYTAPGTYTVSMYAGLERIQFALGNAATNLKSLEQWGDIEWSSMENAFRGASNMVYNAGDVPNLFGVRNTGGMFRDATTFDGDLSGWDVSKVTDMSFMFDGASSFNGNISSWNVSAVTNMNRMFSGTSSFNGNISGWDVSAVTNMNRMFSGTSSFNGNISGWDVSAVTNMNRMFSGTSSFNGNISSWNVSAVTDMNSMFSQASKFNQPLNNWNVSAVTNMNRMFSGTSSFNGNISSWNVSAVTNMNSMFAGASSFNGNISSWNVSAVTNMNSMFVVASSFNGDLSGWDVSAVTNMDGMFDFATSFDQNLGNWYVTLDSTEIDLDVDGRVVGVISAQNGILDRHSPTYGIGDGTDSDLFVVNSTGKTLELDLDASPLSGVYKANITSTGFFGTGNHRVLNVTVTDENPVLEDVMLESIGPQNVDELEALSFMASASGGDGTLTFSLGAGAPAGATINSTTGAFSWTPTEEQDGSHDITVTVTDDNGSDSKTVAVTVGEVNAPPMLGSIGSQDVTRPGTLEFNATATDADVIDEIPDTLTFSLGAPAGATINSTTGSFSWTPTAQQVGSHNITVTVTDGTDARDSEEVAVTVAEAGINEPPVLATIGPQNVDELEALSFMASASGGDGTLTFSLGAGAPAGATINSTTGAFSWTPTEEQDGSHDITVTVTDDNGSDSKTVAVTVGEVNAPPMLGSIGSQDVTRPGTLEFNATATDADVIDEIPDTLTFSLGAPAGATINSTTGSFSWTPTAQQVGSHNITVTVTDGTDARDSEEVAVTVAEAGINEPPVLATIGPQNVDELEALSFMASASGGDGTLTFSLGAGAPAGATINSTTGAFSWTPTEEQDGSHDITVTVTDDNGSDSKAVAVTVVEVNAPPMLGSIGSQDVTRPGTLEFNATATDADVIDEIPDTLTFSLGAPAGATINSTTGSFSWTPTAQQVGSHNITVTVTDGTDARDSEEVAVTVAEAGINEPPVLATIGPQNVDELEALSFMASASGGDGTLTFSLGAGAPAGATINSTTGAFSWTPTEEQDGSHDITVTVTDDNGSDSKTVAVTVGEVNAPPMLGSIGSQDVTRPGTLEFNATATDADVIDEIPDTLTFSLGAPAGATINSTTGSFSWTPTAQQVGSHNITVTVTDGTDARDSEEVAVTVAEAGINEPPVLATIGPQNVDELEALSFTATATDGDGDPLTFTLTDNRPRGASITSGGLFEWTPDQSQDGDYSITVQVSDGRGGTASEVVDITVHDIAPLPVSARALSSSAITLTLSEVVLTDAQMPNGFFVTTQGDHVSVDSITGNGTTTLVLGLNGTISRSDSITLGYLETAGDVADLTGKPLASFSDMEVLFPSSRSRSSSPPPAIAVESPGYPNSQIPQWVIDDAGLDKSHDARAPMAPITVDDTFDFPLEIDGQGYLLRSAYNTLVPHTVTAGQPTEITFTVYLQKEIMYFALYLNMQGSDTDYHDSDTYIVYDGTTRVTDPHRYISDATITVHDAFEGQRSQKKTVNITLEFAAPMGPTNMVVYTWDTDRRSTIVRMVDALDVTVVAAADPEPITPDSELPADPEPAVPDSGLPADPEPVPRDTPWPDDYDDAQVLTLIRMWSGFESESITDAQLLELLGLEDYRGVDLPDWMMTELGVLVAKGDVTVEEFLVALQYVLEHA